MVVNGKNLLAARVDGIQMNDLKTMIDEFKQKLGSAVIVLASAVDGKVALACGVTKDYVEQGQNAGKIVKEVAVICGGNGGGRPDMATAGATDVSQIEAGLAKVAEILSES
jgi:alanyl-tRNA synthetase